jgi:hypothetical protein
MPLSVPIRCRFGFLKGCLKCPLRQPSRTLIGRRNCRYIQKFNYTGRCSTFNLFQDRSLSYPISAPYRVLVVFIFFFKSFLETRTLDIRVINKFCHCTTVEEYSTYNNLAETIHKLSVEILIGTLIGPLTDAE